MFPPGFFLANINHDTVGFVRRGTEGQAARRVSHHSEEKLCAIVSIFFEFHIYAVNFAKRYFPKE